MTSSYDGVAQTIMDLSTGVSSGDFINVEKSHAELCGQNNSQRSGTSYVCGCPSLNIAKTKKAWEDYDIKALPGMMSWIEIAKPLDGRVFQYNEVLGKLREYNPPHRYEFTFVRKLLLPKLSTRGIKIFPLDLVAILYTLHVPCRECKFLSATLDRDPISGLENGDLFLQFQYEDTGKIWSYRVKNFEHPEIARLEVVE